MGQITSLQNRTLAQRGFNQYSERQAIPMGVSFDELDKDTKTPQDNANDRKIFAQNSAPLDNYQEGDLWFIWNCFKFYWKL